MGCFITLCHNLCGKDAGEEVLLQQDQPQQSGNENSQSLNSQPIYSQLQISQNKPLNSEPISENIYTCYLCEKRIVGNSVHLSCYCVYHGSCLTELISGQLMSGSQYYICNQHQDYRYGYIDFKNLSLTFNNELYYCKDCQFSCLRSDVYSCDQCGNGSLVKNFSF